jgi:hypothetical protein
MSRIAWLVVHKLLLPKRMGNISNQIAHRVYFVRNHRIMLDADLAELYGVQTKNLNKAVQRNIERFPEDFMFRLTKEEFENLRFQTGTSSLGDYGGRRYIPYAFTEHGVAMLSGVLRSPRAIQVNLEIVRVFIRLRQLLETHRDLEHRLTSLENKYNAQFKAVFDAIRELIRQPGPPPKRRVGF